VTIIAAYRRPSGFGIGGGQGKQSDWQGSSISRHKAKRNNKAMHQEAQA